MDEELKAYVPNLTEIELIKAIFAKRWERLHQQCDEAQKVYENYKKRIKDRESRET